MNQPPITAIVEQHVEEAAHLRRVRTRLLCAPHVGLWALDRLDERVAAHLDGIAVAGDVGARLANEALARPGCGEMFVAGVLAIESGDEARLADLWSIAEAGGVDGPDARRGLLSAHGWVARGSLRAIARGLLRSDSPLRRAAGLDIAALHGIDPGPWLDAAIGDADPTLRAAALRLAGRLGTVARRERCVRALQLEGDPACAEAAAAASVLLGDRRAAVEHLHAVALDGAHAPPHRVHALTLLLGIDDRQRARRCLQALAREAAMRRVVVWGMGRLGDPVDVPWLLGVIDDPDYARLAGEAIGWITGCDLAALARTVPPPDETDDDVPSMDEDAGLPWPDPPALKTWWRAEVNRFPAGVPHLLGEPATSTRCVALLRSGTQRQRTAAAMRRSLLAPGTPLFDVRAPAWRQQRRLREM